MTELVMGWFAAYGLPVLFFVLGLSALGIPMPVKLPMLVVGAVVGQGEIAFWQAMAAGSLGAITGDQVGFLLGRHGGRPIVEKYTARYGGSKLLEKAEWSLRRWGMLAIFFSRWLITPIGPWLNLICGSVRYPWITFSIVAVAGEVLWVLIYILLGMYFSDRVQDTADLLIDLTWTIAGLAAASYLGSKLFRYLTNHNTRKPAELNPDHP